MIPGGNYGYTGAAVETLTSFENTLALTLFDESGSTRAFARQMELAVKQIVRFLRSAEVVQVIDDSHAILRLVTITEERIIRDSLRVHRIGGERIEEIIWATVPTKNMVTDKWYTFTKDGPTLADSSKTHGPLQSFKVSGTKTYQTTLGTKTVFVVEPCDDPVQFPEKAEKPKPRPKQNNYRTWTSADGKFTVEAKLVMVIADSIRLEKRDGMVIDVPRSKISGADWEWIKNR